MKLLAPIEGKEFEYIQDERQVEYQKDDMGNPYVGFCDAPEPTVDCINREDLFHINAQYNSSDAPADAAETDINESIYGYTN